jgi:FecR protein
VSKLFPRILRQCLPVILLPMLSAQALGQPAQTAEGIGVVTAIQGQARVARQALPQPASLRFRDDVFFRDLITTRERSTVRLLLGGKGTLTIREQSQVTLDESVAPDGTRQSVLVLLAGKIGAAIARALMRPGESVEIHTPNAVAAVRGTVLIAEYLPPQGRVAAPQPVLLASAAPQGFLAQAPGAPGGTSNFLVLSGQAIITPQGQSPLALGSLQAVSVTTGPAGVQAGAIQTLTTAQAVQAAQGLQTGKAHTGEAEGTAQAQALVAAALANAILQAAGQAPTTPAYTTPGPYITQSPLTKPFVDLVVPGVRPGGQPPVVSPTPPVVQPPVVSPTPPVVQPPGGGGTPGGENILPFGALLSLKNVSLELDPGTPLATFGSGPANTIAPLEISMPGNAGVKAPLLEATGSHITHVGPMVSLDPSFILGDSSDRTTPLVRIDATTLVNTGGPVFDVSDGSAIAASGPLLKLENGGNAALAGVLRLTGGSTGGSEVALGPGDGLVISSGSSLTATESLFSVAAGGLLRTREGGGLVTLDPSTLRLFAPIVTATGNSQVALSGPVLRTVNSTVAATGPLAEIGGASSLTMQGGGSLLRMNGGSANISGSLLTASAGATINTSAATGPLVQLDTATLNGAAEGSLIGLNSGASLAGNGRVLDGVNSHITIGGPVLALRGGSSLELSGGPVVRLVGGSLTAQGGLTDSDGAGNQAILRGTLLDASDANITLGPGEIRQAGPADSDVTTFALPKGMPQISLTRSTLTSRSTGRLLDFGSGGGQVGNVGEAPALTHASRGEEISYGGRLLVATNSRITTDGDLVHVGAGDRVFARSRDALVQLQNSELGAGRNLLTIGAGSRGDGSARLYMNGPFLDADNSSLSVAGSGVHVSGPGSLSTGGLRDSPVIRLTGSSLTIGENLLTICCGLRGTPAFVYLEGPFFEGSNSDLAVAGSLASVSGGGRLKTGRTSAPVIALTGGTHAIGSATGIASGSLLDLTGVNTDLCTGLGTDVVLQAGGRVIEAKLAVINLSGAGNAVKVDTAVLKAAGPIISLINSRLNTSPTGDSATGAMHVFRSHVTALGRVFELDKSTLTVHSGPLLSLTGGSSMAVDGDFARLTTGSKIWVQNGPLISVSGTNPTGTPSTLIVTGALIRFSGPGNQVIVNNSIPVTGSTSGVPFHASGAGSSVSIGRNPIENLGSGGTVSFTGSVIQATGGGRVTIKAP